MEHIICSQLLSVDLEATCWKGYPPPGQRQEIIQIGLCTIDLTDLTISKPQSIYILPDHSTVSSFCTELTGITQDVLYGAGVPFLQACQWVQEAVDGKCPPWITWGRWDRQQYLADLKSRGGFMPFSEEHLNAKSIISSMLKARQGLGLNKALRRLGLDFEGQAHDAGVDAYNAARAWIKSVELFRTALGVC